MDMPSQMVYRILKDKGVDYIYHADSVITACQFLRTGSLISRGMIERRKMYQSRQKSDRIDKRLGLWFDVFVDSVDIHSRASRANLYGPVLFVLNSIIIKRAYTGRVWVTKLNPTKWVGKSHEERWFTSEEDLEENFMLGQFDQMIVFRHCGGELPFNDYLETIILDDPQLKTNGSSIDYYSMAYGALKLAMTEGNLDIPIKKRRCLRRCNCLDFYESNLDIAKQMFIPKI